MKASAAELLKTLSRPANEKWPEGERFARPLAHGSMSAEISEPLGHDPQTWHAQDELYFAHSGRSLFVAGDQVTHCEPGDCLFVAAGVKHRFENFSDDFALWVVFRGPDGGEHRRPSTPTLVICKGIQ